MSGKSSSVVAIIPARGQSKGIPKKNSRLLGGYPLIAYSVVAALECPEIDRVIVSTDSEDIAEVARGFGGETPFLRPSELATDSAPDLGYMRHALEWLVQNQGSAPEYLLQFRPTTPLRDSRLITDAIRQLRAREDATGLRSIHPLSEPPQKMVKVENGFLTGFFPNDPRPEYYNLPRQTFPPAYHPNGYIDIVKPSTMKSTATLYGTRVLGFITPVSIEIDTLQDWDDLEWRLEKTPHPLQSLVAKRHSKKATSS